MKIIYPFKNSGIEVKAVSDLKHPTTRKRYSDLGATHCVINPHGICYALAGDEESANLALKNLLAVEP